MDNEKIILMRIVQRAEALRAEEVRKKHIETGCQTCMDRQQFEDEEVNNE